MNSILSFNSDEQLKTDLLAEVEKHEKLDQIVQGYYGKENGKWLLMLLMLMLMLLMLLGNANSQ